jgi:hypothetical protein
VVPFDLFDGHLNQGVEKIVFAGDMHRNIVGPKNCTQILKSLDKYNYIKLLAYREYVLWYIILLNMKIKEMFKICALRDCLFDRIFCVAGHLQ